MPNPTPARLLGVVGMGAAVMVVVAARAARWCAMAVAVPPLPKDSSQPSVLRQELLHRLPLRRLLLPRPRPLPLLRRNRNPLAAPAVAAQLPLVSRWLSVRLNHHPQQPEGQLSLVFWAERLAGGLL